MRDATAALLPAAAILAELPDAERRAAISRLATLTPGVFYGSRDLSEASESAPTNGYVPAFCTLAAHGPRRIAPGGYMTASFENLRSGEECYGSWSIHIEREDISAEGLLAAAPTAAEADLAKLEPDALRDQLSSLTNTLTLSLFVSPGFAAGVPDKAADDGSEIDTLGRGAMYLCSALKGDLQAGTSRRLRLSSVLHGGQDPAAWIITVTRKTNGVD